MFARLISQPAWVLGGQTAFTSSQSSLTKRQFKQDESTLQLSQLSRVELASRDALFGRRLRAAATPSRRKRRHSGTRWSFIVNTSIVDNS